MTPHDTLETIKSLIAETCDIDRSEIQTDGRLIAYGLDSVRAMDLIIAIEETTGVILGREESVKIQTVDELATVVDQKRNAT